MSIVCWFFYKAELVLDALSHAYSEQEAKQEIAWALEDAYNAGKQAAYLEMEE